MVVALCDNVMIFHFLNDPSTGQYVNYVTGWYCGYFCGVKPKTQGFSNMDVHSTKAQGIQSIVHIIWPSFGSNRIY